MAQRVFRSQSPDEAMAGELGLPTPAAAWAKGAKGEEIIGRRLETLPAPRWFVSHDLRPFPGSKWNVDHLVIGPSGVFVVDSKHLAGSILVSGGHLSVDGHPCDFLEKVEAEALQVRAQLLPVLGWDTLWVQGVVAFVNADIEVERQPGRSLVTTDRDIAKLLQSRPAQYSPAQVRALVRAASDRATWR